MRIKRFNESWSSILPEKFGLKEYFIIENFKNFRNDHISFLLFRICNVGDNSFQVEQLKYYYKGKLELSFRNYPQTYEIDFIKPHVVYQTNNKKEAEEMLDTIQISNKYNL